MDIHILDKDVYYSNIITLQFCKSDYNRMNFEEHIYYYLDSLRHLVSPSVSSLKPVATLLVPYMYYVL